MIDRYAKQLINFFALFAFIRISRFAKLGFFERILESGYDLGLCRIRLKFFSSLQSAYNKKYWEEDRENETLFKSDRKTWCLLFDDLSVRVEEAAQQSIQEGKHPVLHHFEVPAAYKIIFVARHFHSL